MADKGGMQALRWRAVVILLVNSLFFVFLLVKPGTHALLVAVDDLSQSLGPLLVLPLCLWGHPWRRGPRGGSATTTSRTAQRWAPYLLALGVLSAGLGESTWTVYELVLRQQTPFPSWADIGFLGAYPFLLGGILLLPARPLSAAVRLRIVLDGLMTMTAIVTLSWYFILGPTLLQGGETLLGKVVGTAYPLSDLVLVACLLVLVAHSADAALRPVVRILALGLAIIVITDTYFAYTTLHGTFATGGLMDPTWPLGYMLVGLAAYALRQRLARPASPLTSVPEDTGVGGEATVLPVWRALLPYAVIPVVGALLLYLWHTHGDASLKSGVYVGSALLVGLVLLRQVVALLENRRLLHKLHAANTRLEALATTDPLTDLSNHRAMIAALAHEVERARRFGRPCAVLFLDLDHFKALNDGYGHPAGDAALRDLTAVMRRHLRGIDTLGRWGGEEFVALLPETDATAALVVAERLRRAVATHTIAVGGGLHLTCSIGVATYPHDGEDRAALVEAADHAMYVAKCLGRNQVRDARDPAVASLMAANGPAHSREDTALTGTVEALAALVEARDQSTGDHSQAIATLTLRVALVFGLEAAEARMVALAARLHDIGKVAIPDAILLKPAQLSADEWARMRTHPVVGAEVVSRVPALRMVAPLIRGHHERWDGRGYPDGLAGEAIPLGARLIAVADAYGAMTSERSYQQARDAVAALSELQRCAGTQFDPAVVEAFARALGEDGVRPGVRGAPGGSRKQARSSPVA